MKKQVIVPMDEKSRDSFAERDREREKSIRDSLEMCDDIYRYYERTKHSIDYFDIHKNSIIYLPASEIRVIDVPEPEEFHAAEKAIRKKNSLASQLLIAAFSIFIAVIVAKGINTFLIQDTRVGGESMMPTIANGDSILLDVLTYRFSDPKRYDIVVFTLPNGEHLIKRVIGLPGEKVRIRKGKVYINGQKLKDDPIQDDIEYYGVAETSVTVDEDTYFVIGDNRNSSFDSRYEEVGNIAKSMIVGKVWVRIFPLQKFGTIK